MIPNVLAERYATGPMKALWAPETRIRLEREFWIAMMKAQNDLGVNVPAPVIADYERVKDDVNLPSIAARERVTRHDVKARIDEFNSLAGHEHIHKGMTSRDLTENVEQLLVHRALLEIRRKGAAALSAVKRRAVEWRSLPLTARTHNVPAQLTTMGKRAAMFGEELLSSFQQLETLLQTFAVRGVKGAVGTQLDQLRLLDGDPGRVQELERHLAAHLGLPRTLQCVGQVYPRSFDLRVVSALHDLCAAPSSFATTLRLMAGHDLATEGFAEGQTGSSAMPHKVNSRSCERINGLHVLLKGHLAMAAALSGEQWNEGDVSCSVVRRVMLPDAFFAADGLIETFLVVLQQMQVFPGMLAREVELQLPFLLTTTFLMTAVKSGVGRETAHEVIKEHAVAVGNALRSGEVSRNNLVERLVADPRLKLSPAEAEALLSGGRAAVGTAEAQVDEFARSVEAVERDHPGASDYRPGSIL